MRTRDAAASDRVSDPQVAWARRVVDRLDPRPDALVVSAARAAGAGDVDRWGHPSAERAEGLAPAGLADVETWLQPAPVTAPEPATCLARVVLREHDDAEALAEAVLAELGDPPVLDDVRLDLVARRPA